MIGPPLYVMPLYFGVALAERLILGMMPTRLDPAVAPTELEAVCGDVKVGRISALKEHSEDCAHPLSCSYTPRGRKD
jgi:hypothetical protein